jgi:N-formylglutamate amidohydrolase
VAQFNAKTDSNTAALTEKLADALEQKTGKRPYVVIARFHRKFIDANRSAKSAYESEQAKPVYDAYQQALATARQEIIARWGRGVLLDIHGQAAAAKTIFRGTRNGKTVTHLVKRFGKDALTGGQSMFGQLAEQGFDVAPPANSNAKEDKYTGGHIVLTYGSAAGGTFDAIQLEFGSHHRSAAEIPATAGKVANAIAAFAKQYLPAEEQKPQGGDAHKQVSEPETHAQ